MPSYTIKHLTRYTYAAPVIDCANQLMIYPLEDERLEVKRHEVVVSSDPELAFFTDYFGNKIGVFTIIKPHNELLIESNLEVITSPIQFPMDEEAAEQQWHHLASLHQDAAFIDFLTPDPSPLQQEIYEVLQSVTDQHEKPLKNALVLSEYVYDHFQYEQGVTNVETPTEEIWRLRAGVCQDFAHMLLYMLRLTGIPARYVSGYVCPKQEGMRGTGATHAWVEAYIPFYGWLGLDPTNNCIVNDGHVRMALGRHFSDCTPIKGTYKGTGAHTLTVSVHIENGEADTQEPLFEEPVYVQEAKVPIVPVNSYRKYVTWEQQQQQQQQ
ncbi:MULTISPECIES: transglutaminase domain-containing protein [Hymenobacter]|uniref:Transglutaminase-like enzyme, putative cysteine protease n=1 Tax=Hymenobacter mucosus TaxID=1411120 RepID=A0A238WEG2_9BACT|nr:MULTISPECIES: transglutaminase family protein [Hymenobacter]SNR44664.1 Transglutaminase-like enzyme, putative cysteine protease [Hymenobacter mucosus]